MLWLVLPRQKGVLLLWQVQSEITRVSRKLAERSSTNMTFDHGRITVCRRQPFDGELTCGAPCQKLLSDWLHMRGSPAFGLTVTFRSCHQALSRGFFEGNPRLQTVTHDAL